MKYIDMGLDLTFTSELDVFVKTETVELIPGKLSHSDVFRRYLYSSRRLFCGSK